MSAAATPPTSPELAVAPADDLVPVTLSNSLNVFGIAYNQTNGGDVRACRGLLVGTAGTANIVTAKGNLRSSVPLQVGWNPLRCIQIKTGGTASDIWAVV